MAKAVTGKSQLITTGICRLSPGSSRQRTLRAMPGAVVVPDLEAPEVLVVPASPAARGLPEVPTAARVARGLTHDVAEREEEEREDEEADVRAFVPDLPAIAALDTFALIVTAPGDEVDFVSRFFAPRAGVPEDPVTGSAHSTLIPFWAHRLGKTTMRARQVSARGGELPT